MKITKKFNERTETNYLATAFEGLCSLRHFVLNISDMVKVNDRVLYLFYLLQGRYNGGKGLYSFLDGDMRMDMTGHTLNGMIVL